MHSDNTISLYVDELLNHAIQNHASDIHIEPFRNECQIRYRRDGLLYLSEPVSLNFATRVTTRLKILAALDIAEKRLPQDGKLQFNNTDIRISICPTIHGEKAVLRLLNTTKLLELNKLGMKAEQLDIFRQALIQPHGLILVTGATGSGKTMTLYAALQYLNSSEKNIITVEDPVEIELRGLTQIQVNPRIGLTFPVLLRTLLRQDPDILMIGEIRDRESAEIALQAAQTGHLVLATLHANTAQGALIRLRTMGIPEYYFTDAILLVVSQRLMRRADEGRSGSFELCPLNVRGLAPAALHLLQ